MLEEALSCDANISAIIFCPALLHSERGIQALKKTQARSIQLFSADETLFTSLSDTVTSQGIFAVIRHDTRAFRVEDVTKKSLLVALNDISDPGNAGTIIRTADWFGADAVLFDATTVELTNPKTLRSTAGSNFHIPVYEGIHLSDILPRLQQSGFKIYASSANGSRNLFEMKSFEKCLFIFGNEGAGVNPEIEKLCDATVAISRFGKAESLNVSVAAGIFMAHLSGKKKQVNSK